MSNVLSISVDGHVTAKRDAWRPYLAREFIEEYDAWLRASEELPEGGLLQPDLEPEVLWDSDLRLRELESQGVVAEVLFPNGTPFSAGFGADAGGSPARGRAARRAYNRWLADFCAAAPGRRAGLAMISFVDIDDEVAEIRWAKDNGLMGVVLPGLEPGAPYYLDPALDSIWATCQDLGLVVTQHGGANMSLDMPMGFASIMTIAVENASGTARSLFQMILGGVFERFPDLKYALTEAHTDWLPGMLTFADWLVDVSSDWAAWAEFCGRESPISRTPSEYWASNCFVGASFLSRNEAEMRSEIGIDNIMFGVDYPHFESTAPNTKDWIRASLGYTGASEVELRKILGENAVRAYGFDRAILQPHVDRVGFSAAELLDPIVTPNPEIAPVLRAGYASVV